MAQFPHKHLLGIEALSPSDISLILDRADSLSSFNAKTRGGPALITLFYEESTRTRVSFELAALRLGMDAVHIAAAQSSVKKGESLIDTAQTLAAMGVGAIVMRHPETGAAAEIAKAVSCPVINAGDGIGEHPTQALLDALVMRRRKGKLQGLTVAICGDLRHSRVARSNMILLRKMGANVRAVGPEKFLSADIGAEKFTDMKAGLAGADVVMMLRVQKERMDAADWPSPAEYFKSYGLDADKLRAAKPDAIVMHPGPMNRGIEIDSAIADGAQSVILEQVAAGVAVRMAVLQLWTGAGL